MSEPQVTDPTPREFVDSLFAGMRAVLGEIDARAEARSAARAEARSAARAEQRRTTARERRAKAADKLPAALERTLEGNRFTRSEFEGGFHLEPSSDDYRPRVGDLLRITVKGAAQELTATRRPRPGQPERPRAITLHGAIRLLGEFAVSVRENTPAPRYEPDGCQCPNVPSPPCWFCESAEYCERCQEPVGWREWPDHLAEHLYDEALTRARARHRRGVRRVHLAHSRSRSCGAAYDSARGCPGIAAPPATALPQE